MIRLCWNEDVWVIFVSVGGRLRLSAIELSAATPICDPNICSDLDLIKQKVQNPQSGFWTFGPSGETRTRGILVPNQAPYQLGHTRILSYEKKLVVVKYVVKEILPHFWGTFNGDI